MKKKKKKKKNYFRSKDANDSLTFSFASEVQSVTRSNTSIAFFKRRDFEYAFLDIFAKILNESILDAKSLSFDNPFSKIKSINPVVEEK